ncbi:protein ST7 homolog [Pieris rapae]|uniref:protein ST7 homolog n=1 Tax=Pieris rapae TaxID=64459 RepID=UPI001E280D5B|nr:protein ST7 homolog [Pieris rapae]
MWDSSTFLGALTPKFYVALTGTSSLISGLILIFEWWYFRKYGTSFIEQMSLSTVWVGWGSWGTTRAPEGGECKVWRNPTALLRGAEYARLWAAARTAPLTYYDMNLSAQDHQAWLAAAPAWGGADEALARAWREREPAARVAAARAALRLRPDCAAALLLLAEEDAPTVLEAERVLRRAWRAGEASLRALAAAGAGGAARREAALLAHVKRRVAMCARRLGRLKDAARLFRELSREAGGAPHALQVRDNLLEVLLEQRLYADAQAVLARCEDAAAPPTATALYTAALLRARTGPEPPATEALRLAVEFNPYVPAYLLELRALTLPPEHVVRRGDSEALAYAFWHLRHWRRADPALRLLAATAGPRAPPPLSPAARAADRELLPPHHGSAAGARGAPALVPLGAVLCVLTTLTLTAQRWPTLTFDPRELLP